MDTNEPDPPGQGAEPQFTLRQVRAFFGKLRPPVRLLPALVMLFVIANEGGSAFARAFTSFDTSLPLAQVAESALKLVLMVSGACACVLLIALTTKCVFALLSPRSPPAPS